MAIKMKVRIAQWPSLGPLKIDLDDPNLTSSSSPFRLRTLITLHRRKPRSAELTN
jgi:hypothetical protein